LQNFQKSGKIPKPTLIVVVGPTAVGKTQLTISLAKHFGSDIFSCDSRQFYRELSIGTAKPSSNEMEGITHHFINSHSIEMLYSAGDYEREVDLSLKKYFESRPIAIITGGSGLFVKALLYGLDDIPEVSLNIRASLMEKVKNGKIEELKSELKELDPETYKKIDTKNTQRLVRALEVVHSTGSALSQFQLNKFKKNTYNIIKIGLERPREELYLRINKRVDAMIEQGLLKEVESLQTYKNHNALKTVGYKEIFEYLEGEIDLKTAVELIKRNTRRYAKRQLTWFKNQDSFNWFNPNDEEDLIAFIEDNLEF
jgi:tRNA dimethylallyltransferase